jgi:nucleoside-diphosphate-sugar epimerase
MTSSNQPKKILVTGMSGLIGGLVGKALACRYKIRALNRRPVEGVECVTADIGDFASIRPAFDEIDTVIHLAAYAHEDDQLENHVHTNIVGTYNVYEAARLAGVKRIVLGSSGATQSFYEREEPIKAMVEARWADVPLPRPILNRYSPVRPAGLYGASKVWAEVLGRYFADAYRMSVLCIRIGRVVPEDIPRDARHAAVYCSHRDMIQMVERCVEAPQSIRYDIFYAVSRNRGRFRDIEHAKRMIGYEPLDGIANWPLPARDPLVSQLSR